MKVAYFDCFAGASGDMIIGALLDAGLTLDRLKKDLENLNLTHYDIKVKKVAKKGLGGSQAEVIVDEEHHHHHHRHFADLKDIIDKSELEEPVKRKSLEIFRRLAEAEAKVHQTTVEQVHFHEVGAMDAIIDVVGAVAGLAALGIENVYCSPLHVGSGTVECAHGTLPVPAPATAELVRGIPIYSTGVVGELLTPTGAAILTTLSSGFGGIPPMSIEKIGYGAGTSEPAIPNLLRVIIGETREELKGYDMEQVAVIETNIDDMNPQIYDYLIQSMLDLGVLDVCLSPVQMKKNRPGTLLSVVCSLELLEKSANFIMRETTTIGLRWRVENRIKAKRTVKEVGTRYGPVRIKLAEADSGLINVSPEYEDCKRVALKNRVPLKQVMDEARSAALADDFLGK